MYSCFLAKWTLLVSKSLCVCVCVCVCERERERKKERDKEIKREREMEEGEKSQNLFEWEDEPNRILSFAGWYNS